MNYRLIAFDMDGTLLSSKKEVLASSRAAIAEALDAGKVVAICTGRCPKMVELDRESIGDVRYAICCNGTVLYDLVEHRVLSASPLEHDVIARALDALGDVDAMIDAFSGSGFFCQGSHLDSMDQYNMGIYRGLYRATTSLVQDIRAQLLDPSVTYQKFIFHFRDPEAREHVIERVADLPVELAKAEISSLEFTARGVDKGTGLLSLAELLEIPREQTIAVGDSYNDLPMINVAGLGVAMGNSRDAVLAAAGATVADNDSDGCAEAVRRFLLAE